MIDNRACSPLCLLLYPKKLSDTWDEGDGLVVLWANQFAHGQFAHLNLTCHILMGTLKNWRPSGESFQHCKWSLKSYLRTALNMWDKSTLEGGKLESLTIKGLPGRKI